MNRTSLARRVLSRWPATASFARAVRDVLDRDDPGYVTPWGFTLAGHPLMASGNFEPAETQLVRELISQVDIFVNVGANVGYYCCHALSLGKPVVAVEPVARNVHYLLKNIRANDWSDRAEVFPVALARDRGIVDMWGGGTGASLVKGWASAPEEYVTSVPTLTLDRILAGMSSTQRALILIDAEGAEFEVLTGAGATLARTPRPIWLVEISHAEHRPIESPVNPHFAKTFSVFFDKHYRAYTADEHRTEITRARVLAVAEGTTPAPTHNYLFLDA